MIKKVTEMHLSCYIDDAENGYLRSSIFSSDSVRIDLDRGRMIIDIDTEDDGESYEIRLDIDVSDCIEELIKGVKGEY